MVMKVMLDWVSIGKLGVGPMYEDWIERNKLPRMTVFEVSPRAWQIADNTDLIACSVGTFHCNTRKNRLKNISPPKPLGEWL